MARETSAFMWISYFSQSSDGEVGIPDTTQQTGTQTLHKLEDERILSTTFGCYAST